MEDRFLINWNSIKVLRKNGFVVLVNEYTRHWAKISEEVFAFLVDLEGTEVEEVVGQGCEQFTCLEREFAEFIQRLTNKGLTRGITADCSIAADKFDVHGREGVERTVTFYVTHRCNLTCVTCFRDANNDSPEELSLVQAKKTIELLKEQYDCKRLSITGGEPLLREDIVDIVEHAKQVIGHVVLQTNATLMSEGIARKMREYVNLVRVGLDGSKPSINDPIRGEGAFQRTVKGIETLVKNEVPVLINATLLRTNLSDMRNLKSLADNYKAGFICGWFCFAGRGKER